MNDSPITAPSLHGGYVYRRRLPRFLASGFDRLAPPFFKRAHPHPTRRPSTFRRIAVLRADQIGDIVLALPFIRALRQRYPGARITLVTSPAGRELLRSVKDACDVCVFEAPWFGSGTGVWGAMRRLESLFKALQADAVVDLRGDVRHLWAARCALPDAWIEGYGITGGGFLADFVPVYRPGRHAALKNLEFMDVEVPNDLSGVELPSDLASSAAEPAWDDRVPAAEGPWVAFHAGASSPSKRWPERSWLYLAEQLLKKTRARIVWIGDRQTGIRSRHISDRLKSGHSGRSRVLCESVSLSSLNTLLGRCRLLVSHDSGPVHVAAALRLPTLVLFSGANDPAEWRPLNPNAFVYSSEVACSPCGLKVCNQPAHRCMESIDPDAVAERMIGMMP